MDANGTLALAEPSALETIPMGVLVGSNERFAEHLTAIRHDLNPAGVIESLLADQILLAITRLRRIVQTATDDEARDSKIHEVEQSLFQGLDALQAQKSRSEPHWGQSARVSERLSDLPSLPPLPCESWSGPDFDFELDEMDDPANPNRVAKSQGPQSRDSKDSADDRGHWRSRLVFDGNVSEHSPVVRGTWITAGQVVSMLIDGWSRDEILKHYPELSKSDIQACLGYCTEQDGPIVLQECQGD